MLGLACDEAARCNQNQKMRNKEKQENGRRTWPKKQRARGEEAAAFLLIYTSIFNSSVISYMDAY